MKQYEIMNKDLSRTIHGQKEQIDLLHNEKMEGKVKIEILSKANEAMKTELSNVREQLLSVSSERDSKKKIRLMQCQTSGEEWSFHKYQYKHR